MSSADIHHIVSMALMQTGLFAAKFLMHRNMRNGAVVDGAVVGYETRPDGDGDPVKMPVVEFTIAGQGRFRFVETYFYSRNRSIGEAVTVVYSKDSPDIAHIRRELGGGFGVGLVAMGVVAVVMWSGVAAKAFFGYDLVPIHWIWS